MPLNSLIVKIKNFSPHLILKIGLLSYLILIFYSILLIRNIRLKNKFYLINNSDNQILINFNVSDLYVFFEIFGNEEYKEVKNFKLNEVNVVDVGANIGLFYTYLKSLGIKIPVYLGIEPNQENLKCLSFNTFSSNSTLFPFALWKDRNGVSLSNDFSTSKKTIVGNSIPSVTFEDLKSSIPIDSAVKNLLKMDIEGTEYIILDENSELITKLFDYIIIEFHGNSQVDINEFFQKNFPNYEYTLESKNDFCSLVFAKKN